MPKCFYCGLEMFPHHTPHKEIRKYFGVEEGAPYTRKLIKYARMTKEHLIRKADGGTSVSTNIVYAHAYCNTTRQNQSVTEHKEAIQNAVANGWHPLTPKEKNNENV
jgi:hypothetical protein